MLCKFNIQGPFMINFTKTLAIKLYIRGKIADIKENVCPEYRMDRVTGLGKFQLHCCDGNTATGIGHNNQKINNETQKCRVRPKIKDKSLKNY